MDANLDIQRRFTWKESMDNGSSESHFPHFTQDMLWIIYVGHQSGSINDRNKPYHSRKEI